MEEFYLIRYNNELYELCGSFLYKIEIKTGKKLSEQICKVN
jgi:hypothetical protein